MRPTRIHRAGILEGIPYRRSDIEPLSPLDAGPGGGALAITSAFGYWAH